MTGGDARDLSLVLREGDCLAIVPRNRNSWYGKRALYAETMSVVKESPGISTGEVTRNLARPCESVSPLLFHPNDLGSLRHESVGAEGADGLAEGGTIEIQGPSATTEVPPALSLGLGARHQQDGRDAEARRRGLHGRPGRCVKDVRLIRALSESSLSYAAHHGHREP